MLLSSGYKLLKEAHDRKSFVSIVAFHEDQETQAQKIISEQAQILMPVVTIVDKRSPFAAAQPILHANYDQLKIHPNESAQIAHILWCCFRFTGHAFGPEPIQCPQCPSEDGLCLHNFAKRWQSWRQIIVCICEGKTPRD